MKAKRKSASTVPVDEQKHTHTLSIDVDLTDPFDLSKVMGMLTEWRFEKWYVSGFLCPADDLKKRKRR